MFGLAASWDADPPPLASRADPQGGWVDPPPARG